MYHEHYTNDCDSNDCAVKCLNYGAKFTIKIEE